MSCECSDPHIFSFTISAVSGYFPLKDINFFIYCKPTVVNIQTFFILDSYSIVWPGKWLLKIFPLLSRSQSKNWLVLHFAQLNWSSKSTITLYIWIIKSSGWTLHIFTLLYFTVLFNICTLHYHLDNLLWMNLVIFCWKFTF